HVTRYQCGPDPAHGVATKAVALRCSVPFLPSRGRLLFIASPFSMVLDHPVKRWLSKPSLAIIRLCVFVRDRRARATCERWFAQHNTCKKDGPFPSARMSAAFVPITTCHGQAIQINSSLDEADRELLFLFARNIERDHQAGNGNNAR